MYRLALRLGQPNVDKMLRSMTSRQLREWMLFMKLEPFGDDRQDVRHGLLLQSLLNIHRDRKRKPKPYTLAECVVSGGDQFTEQQQQPKRQTWQEMKMIAMIMTTSSSR